MKEEYKTTRVLLPTEVDFRDLNLRNANLEGAFPPSNEPYRFDHSDMGCALLRGVQLPGATFLGTNLNDARLSGALLCDADFRHASAVQADFAGADLEDADFYGANLQGANFRGTNLLSASFYSADLQGARFDGAAIPESSHEVIAEVLRQSATTFDSSSSSEATEKLKAAALIHYRTDWCWADFTYAIGSPLLVEWIYGTLIPFAGRNPQLALKLDYYSRVREGGQQ